MAKRKRRRKSSSFYNRGQLHVSNLIGVLLALCLIVAVSMKLYVTQHNVVDDSVATEPSNYAQHQQFIKTIGPYAQQMQRQYGILPSITMAQAILESDW